MSVQSIMAVITIDVDLRDMRVIANKSSLQVLLLGQKYQSLSSHKRYEAFSVKSKMLLTQSCLT